MKIDWRRKLSSRKFICALAAIAGIAVISVFGGSLTQAQTDVISRLIYGIIAYIAGESAVDISRNARSDGEHSEHKEVGDE